MYTESDTKGISAYLPLSVKMTAYVRAMNIPMKQMAVNPTPRIV